MANYRLPIIGRFSRWLLLHLIIIASNYSQIFPRIIIPTAGGGIMVDIPAQDIYKYNKVIVQWGHDLTFESCEKPVHESSGIFKMKIDMINS